eukprot:5565900-Ditylum_brightwellii.AAC.1
MEQLSVKRTKNQSVEVGEEYRTSNSLRRGSLSQATNQEVDQEQGISKTGGDQLRTRREAELDPKCERTTWRSGYWLRNHWCTPGQSSQESTMVIRVALTRCLELRRQEGAQAPADSLRT